MMLLLSLTIGIIQSNSSSADAAPQPRPSAADIPTGTLIIGTHLIHIKALNSELLDIAKKSAQSSQQEAVYYKSEFANGTWFDISNASGFSDIATAGKPVQNSVIDSLVLTHWTKEDGKTIDLTTGAVVNIHDINDPSDLSTLTELAELKTRRELLIETLKNQDTNENRQKLGSIERIILTRFRSNELNAIDQKLDAMEKYIQYLRDKKTQDDWVNAVVELKTQLNNEKLLLCYREAVSRLNKEILFVENNIKDEDGKKVPATDLSSAYYTCLDAVNKKIGELESSLTSVSPSSALDKERAKYKDAIIAGATSSNYSSADLNLEKYMAIANILKGLKLNIPLELSILNPLLVQTSQELYNLSTAGISPEYVKAQKAGESPVILESIKKEQLSAISSLMSDVQALIGYIKERETDQAKLESAISSVLSGCLNALSKVPEDDIKSDTSEILKNFMNWLNAELSLIKGENLDQEMLDKLKELDALISQRTTDYLTALDNRDLALAEAIKKEIEDIAAQKAEIYASATEELGNLLKRKASIEAELEKALARGDNVLAGELLSQLSAIDAALEAKKATADELTVAGSELLDRLFSELEDSLKENDFPAALSILNEISDALKTYPSMAAAARISLNNILPDVEKKQNEALLNNRFADAGNLAKIKELITNLLGLTFSDVFDDIGTENLEDAVLTLLDNLLLQSGLNPDSTQAQLLKIDVLDQLAQMPELSQLHLRLKELQDEACSKLDDSYFLEDIMWIEGICYVNLKELAVAADRRYVWLPNVSTVSITKGKSTLVFQKNTSNVEINGKAKSMDSNAFIHSNYLYVPLDFIANELDYMYLVVGTNNKMIFFPAAVDKTVKSLMQ